MPSKKIVGSISGRRASTTSKKIPISHLSSNKLLIWVIIILGALIVLFLANQKQTTQPDQPQAATIDKIVFWSDRQGGEGIYVMNKDGTGLTKISSHRYDRNPEVSKDGNKIVFESFRDGNQEIYIMDITGSNPKRLTTNTVPDMQPSFTPSGSKVVFARISPKTSPTAADNHDIYIMNIDGSNVKRLTNNGVGGTETSGGYEVDPAVSPNGNKIVYKREGNLYTMNIDGTGQTKLNVSGANQLKSPSYSPGGTQIIFVGNPTNENINTSVFVVSTAGGKATKLNQTLFFKTVNGYTSQYTDLSYNPTYSPDGTKILFSTNSSFNIPIHGVAQLYIMDANGLNKQRILTSSGNDYAGSWR